MTKPPPATGVCVLGYAWEEFVAGTLNFRGLLLLSTIDVVINHHDYRTGKRPAGTEYRTTVGELCKLLNCDRRTLRRLIETLTTRRTDEVLRCRKMDNDPWALALKTAPRPGVLRRLSLPFAALDDYRAGHLSGPAVALLGLLGSMRDVNKPNPYLATAVGCSVARLKQLLQELDDRGYVARETSRLPSGKSIRRIIVTEKGASEHAQGETTGRTGHGLSGNTVGEPGPLPGEHRLRPGGVPPDDAGRAGGTGGGPGEPDANEDGGRGGAATAGAGPAAGWAGKLFTGLTASGILTNNRPVPAGWAEAFVALAAERDAASIDRELDWYVRHIAEPYVPEAFCASSFCEKFAKIHAARLRWEREQGLDPDDDALAMPAAPTPSAAPVEPAERKPAVPMTADMQESSDLQLRHDLSAEQVRTLKQMHPEQTFAELDELCYRIGYRELPAYVAGMSLQKGSQYPVKT